MMMFFSVPQVHRVGMVRSLPGMGVPVMVNLPWMVPMSMLWSFLGAVIFQVRPVRGLVCPQLVVVPLVSLWRSTCLVVPQVQPARIFRPWNWPSRMVHCP